MKPYVDEKKIYHNAAGVTYDFSDLTWEQIEGSHQIPAVAGTSPDNSHWERLGTAADRINAEHDEYYRTGRIASHGGTI